MRQIEFIPTFEGWQTAARQALAAGWQPETILWQEGGGNQPSLFSSAKLTDAVKTRVPKKFLELASLAARHSSARRWALLYRVLWRLAHQHSRLLENPADADVIELSHLAKQVDKDAYRMRAFVRFRETRLEGQLWFVAWYEPEHDTLDLNAGFFTDRFANMRWSVLTPRRCMHWDGEQITFSPGAERAAAPDGDDLEPLWITYYSSIFNPARLKPKAMQAQLLKRNWRNLPEALVIEPLMRAAPGRTESMIAASRRKIVRDSDYGTPFVPQTSDLDELRYAASGCQACPLYKQATCTVFGEGPARPRVVLVGEQPGDAEDRAGKPFVGPAGTVLNDALDAAGINRSEVYITNAVKHFKWEPRGKRRIHQTPSSRDIAACRPWLEQELRILRPELIVSLGGTAAHSLFRQPLKVLENRGQVLLDPLQRSVLVTVHPAALLRLPPGSDANAEFQRFVEDLTTSARVKASAPETYGANGRD